MTTENIGQEGKNLNFSVASHSLNMQADKEWLKKYDETKTGLNPFFYVVFILFLISVYGTYNLFVGGSWFFGVLLAFVSLFLGFFSYSLGAATLMKRVAYENGLLLAGKIINVNPIEIVFLADMRADEEKETIFGLRKLVVKSLPHHNLKIGEKIPAVSLFGIGAKGYRRQFEPRPVAWGFENKEVVEKSQEFLENSNDYDDENLQKIYKNDFEIIDKILEKNIDFTDEEVIFFDKNLDKLKIDEFGKIIKI